MGIYILFYATNLYLPVLEALVDCFLAAKVTRDAGSLEAAILHSLHINPAVKED